jgi:uncharacterized protein
MDFILNLTIESAGKVLLTLWYNWPYLLASILIAAALQLFMNGERVSAFLKRTRRIGVIAATTAAVATPLCSCGTTAILLGMMASLMPWAPIIAFMVSSPLTSPGELIYSAGLFGWPFALTFFSASIVLGLAGGLAGAILESRGWLKNQARLAVAHSNSTPLPVVQTSACGCGAPAETKPSVQNSSCGCFAPVVVKPSIKIKDFLQAVYTSGKQLLKLFIGFAFIGYFLNGLIPPEWVAALFGSGNTYSVPLAATLGLPFYISTEASLPLIRALLDAGMSQGAAMAFMISGAGTSLGAIAGALTIARWRVIALVVSVLWAGAIAFGYIYDLLLAAGLV